VSDFTTVWTPLTVASVLAIGLGLGAFLWITERRVTFSCLVHTALPGTAFFAFLLVSREIDRPGAGSFWLGIIALWTVYLVTAFAAVFVRRRIG
jgi:hypothetical protein